MRSHHLLDSLLLASLLCSPAVAQGSIWQANRISRDLHRVSVCGEVLQRVDLSRNGFSLRGVQQAPDGTLWVIDFATKTFTLLDSSGGKLRNIATTGGFPFAVAFDKAGHAWITMTGTNTVQEFDAAGKLLKTFNVAGAPLGIAIDVNGNKWIAHRIGPPGSVSRIDGKTGAVTNHLLPASSQILPTQIAADFPGFGKKSRIWVIGDNRGNSELVEFDSTGKVLNTFLVGPANGGLGSIAIDAAGDIWLGDFRNGSVFQVDGTTGKTKNTFTNLPNVLGLNIDGFGNLWVTTRVSFSGPAPSEVRRYDRATRKLEVFAKVGLGAGSGSSTRWQQAYVVDPLGDLDKDGVVNFAEILTGTSPFDPCSNGTTSLSTRGSTRIGSTVKVAIRAGAATRTGLAFATKMLTPGMKFPGFGCSLRLDPRTIVPFVPAFTGSATFSMTIPNNPFLDGLVLRMQALTIGANSSFSNLACIKVFK